jgi:hypothetical protein
VEIAKPPSDATCHLAPLTMLSMLATPSLHRTKVGSLMNGIESAGSIPRIMRHDHVGEPYKVRAAGS